MWNWPSFLCGDYSKQTPSCYFFQPILSESCVTCTGPSIYIRDNTQESQRTVRSRKPGLYPTWEISLLVVLVYSIILRRQVYPFLQFMICCGASLAYALGTCITWRTLAIVGTLICLNLLPYHSYKTETNIFQNTFVV